MKYIPPLNALPGDEEDEDRSHWNADPGGANLPLRQGAYPSAIGFEACQREIVNVIEEAELEPDGEDYTQLYTAILAIIAANSAAGELPVGSTYENYEDDTNPATLLGYGTWVAMQDRMKIGAGGTYAAGATGGSATTTQSEAQIATHDHPMSGSSSTTANPNAPSTYPVMNSTTQGSYSSGDIGNAGSGAPMNTISPYVALYMWRRVS